MPSAAIAGAPAPHRLRCDHRAGAGAARNFASTARATANTPRRAEHGDGAETAGFAAAAAAAGGATKAGKRYALIKEKSGRCQWYIFSRRARVIVFVHLIRLERIERIERVERINEVNEVNANALTTNAYHATRNRKDIMDLSTTYLGLKLKNPIIAGASNLTADLTTIRRLEEVGAAALVTKSLFEEQLQMQRFKQDDQAEEFSYRHAEMIHPFVDLPELGPEKHLDLVHKAKQAVSIPVIASLNCRQHDTWLQYARQMAATGVDALEINLFATPGELDLPGTEIEQQQLQLVRELKSQINIPISVKLSGFYTNITAIVRALDRENVDGFVLFNQLFQPELDINAEKSVFAFKLSAKGDHRLPLRYSGLLYGQINAGICGSSGIFDGADVVKMLLAGADCVQVVSTLYKNNMAHLEKMLADLGTWMQTKGYERIDDFRGKLSQKNSSDPWMYRRAQYVEALLKDKPLGERQHYSFFDDSSAAAA